MLLHAFFKPPKPLSRHVYHEPGFEEVSPSSAATLYADQSGRLQDPEVTRCRGPTMRKALRNVARRHSSIALAKGKKDLPSGPVRQGTEDSIGDSRFVSSCVGFWRHSVLKVLAEPLIRDNFYF